MTAWQVRRAALAVVCCAFASGDAGAGPSTTADLCRTVDVATIRRVRIDLRPSYFFKVVSDTSLVVMTTEHGNTLLDLSGASARALRIPGTYDPVPSVPDGKIVSVASGVLRFYALDDLQRHGARARAFFESPHVLMSGAYQSMARISYGDGWARYRVIVVSNQDGALRSQQIVVRFRDGVPTEVSDQGPPRRICKRLAPDATSLPMLSKSGQEIALFDGRTTKIFRIDNDECTPVLDLGIPTGKVDFSFDDRRLAFHVGLTRHVTTRTAAQPDMKARLTTWVYDRDAPAGVPALRPVTLNPVGNAYYPVFTSDGQVLYLHAVPAEQGPAYSFVFAAPMTMTSPTGSHVGTRAEVALGQLWRRVCTNEHQAAGVLAPRTVPPHLDPSACRRLVSTKWCRDGHVQLPEQVDHEPVGPTTNDATAFEGPDTADLLSACPRASIPKPRFRPSTHRRRR